MLERIYVAIDIGETFIKAVAMNEYASKLSIVGSTSVKTNGITNGDITSINDLQLSVKEAFSNLEAQVDNFKIEKVLLVLPSSKMNVYRKRSKMEILARDKVITSKDIKDLKMSFSRVDIPIDELIVNIIPISYRVDGGEALLKEPSGLSGSILELEANLITLPSFIARSYVDIIQNLGYEILDAFVSPLALSSILIDNESPINGKVICDIGGKNTLLSFFQNGNLVGTSLVRFGSNLITSEISKQFDLSIERSERLKVEYGTANSQLSEQIVVYSDDTKDLTITEKDLSETISKRLEEYYIELNKVTTNLTKSVNYPMVIIGGGSHLNSIDEQIKIRLGRETNTYISSYIGARNNAFLPCISLVEYYVNKHR